MKKSLFLVSAAAAVLTAWAPKQAEVSIMAGSDAETVISWDFTGDAVAIAGDVTTARRHVSIEHYIDQDIISAVVLSWNSKSCTPEAAAGYDWHVLRFEAWHDVDEAWLTFELGF